MVACGGTCQLDSVLVAASRGRILTPTPTEHGKGTHSELQGRRGSYASEIRQCTPARLAVPEGINDKDFQLWLTSNQEPGRAMISGWLQQLLACFCCSLVSCWLYSAVSDRLRYECNVAGAAIGLLISHVLSLQQLPPVAALLVISLQGGSTSV